MPHVSRSALVVLTLCTTLTSCAWIIPPEKNAPRYNTVMGDSRRPALNPDAGAVAPSVAVADPVPYAMPQPQTYPDMAVTTPMAPQESVRQLPPENGPTNNYYGGYPALNSVPPSPTQMDQEAAIRMARVRAQLEQERAFAHQQRSQLNSAAAADSSWITPNYAPPASMQAPYAPLPPAPSVAVPMSAAPQTYVPPQAPSYLPPLPQAPVALRAPQMPMPPASPPTYPRYTDPGARAVAAQPLQPPAQGSFDPLSGSQQVGGAAPNGGYLPPSRYMRQRGY